ncbi:hypothetical protein ACEWY4_018219 [Coilia grayii]|uniref:Uncharacterized protein n=1 Tax=Coilia grayii TaxID=363190 RepID=A0ABD1JKG9_9TELE
MHGEKSQFSHLLWFHRKEAEEHNLEPLDAEEDDFLDRQLLDDDEVESDIMFYTGADGLSLRRRQLSSTRLMLVISVQSTCEPCQRFEKVKTEPPELKPIKPVAPLHMIVCKTQIASDVPVGELAAVEEEDIEAFVSGRAEAEAVVFDQVRDSVEKAQERQKAAYRRKKKKGTKRFIVTPGMVVLKKNELKRGRPGMTMLPEWPTKYRVISVEDNLVQLQSMDGRPLSTKTPYASVKPLRQRYQTGFSTDRAVGMTSADSSEFVEDTLERLGNLVIPPALRLCKTH